MGNVLLGGATDGVGLALASRYLTEEWRVGIVGRSRDKLDRVEQRLGDEHSRNGIVGVQCDVTDDRAVPGAFDGALERLGRLDLLICCTDTREEGLTPEERYAAAAEILDVNLAGAIHFLELGADHLISADGGHLAAIGSVAGDWSRPRYPSKEPARPGSMPI